MEDQQQTNSTRRLVVRISPTSLSFSTADIGNVSYKPYALNNSISMAANLREALKTEPMLAEQYERVLVMADTPTLVVPTTIFQENEEEALYRYTFSGINQHSILHSVLPGLNSVAIFSLAKDLCTVIGDAFPAARYVPAMTPVWCHLHQRSYTGQHEKLYAYFHEHRMEVVSYGQNRFKFCNSYAVNSPNDAMFFMLSVWKQLGLEAERDELHMVGDLPYHEALMGELQKFIKRVFFIIPSGEFNRAPITQIKDVPYDLITLYVKGL